MAGSLVLVLAWVGLAAPDSERDALLAVYASTAGAGWRVKANWSSVQPLCSWHGVSCDQAGRIRGLWLVDNRLSGTLPAELVQLSLLNRLVLPGNQLVGSLPPGLGGAAAAHARAREQPAERGAAGRAEGSAQAGVGPQSFQRDHPRSQSGEASGFDSTGEQPHQRDRT